MTEKERMIAGLIYSDGDDELQNAMAQCKKKLYEYNNMPDATREERGDKLREILGRVGNWAYIEPPFYCDYGTNILLGDAFYANYNLHILDCARVIIGDNVFIGPMCGIYTPKHPIDAEIRNSGIESAAEIRIGSNVWIGGSVTINPGVTIGSNVVIGSGSVVTKDIPDNSIAVGNPCKFKRAITDEDKAYWSRLTDEYHAEMDKD